MNIFARFFAYSEVHVVALLLDIKKGISVAETDIAKATAWVVSNAPNIAADVQQAEQMVVELGISSNPAVAAAVVAANASVAALNAFAAASASGSTTAQSLVEGYVAVKQAQASAASAAAAAAST